MDGAESFDFALLVLCLWREARGETNQTAKAWVAFSIRNRVLKPRWWGDSWRSVILKPKQYSSFNPGDPNATKFPEDGDTALDSCIAAAQSAYDPATPDPTSGSTHYYDRSMDGNEPGWAKDGSMVHVANVGNLRFWKLA